MRTLRFFRWLAPWVLSPLLLSCASVSRVPDVDIAGRSIQIHELPALPYGYSDLEPAIDAKTMELHHSKHHRGYVDQLNKAATGTPWAYLRLEELFERASKLPAAIRNNAGGHYNHSLFWTMMKPTSKGSRPGTELLRALERDFGGFEAFQKRFEEAALGRFGSGWAWLIQDSEGRLQVVTTPNQDNPLMDVVEKRGYPLLALDIWEHAYYLKYQNRRGEYAKAWWAIVNWDVVTARFLAGAPKS
jgi:Fe-Mn family superoxide dismutase